MTDIDLSNIKPFETRDGSTTLYDEVRDIHYRSWHGAVSESRHVFLDGTALKDRGSRWRVAELGFGAAVNFTQTVQAFRSCEAAVQLIYHSVDWRPVTADHLGFHKGEAGTIARRAVDKYHSDGQSLITVRSDDEAIELHLHAQPWDDVNLAGFSAHAFYHDPFSKRVNAEAWSAESFARAKAAMEEGGRLATYSAATSVKRAMFEAGLSVATAPGPGRKREMTIASPVPDALDGLQLLDSSRYLKTS